MLQKFSVKGFKCFKNEIVFDFSKIRDYEFNKCCVKNNTVSKGVIYGHNSCGKSNLGFAILDIIFHLTDKNTNKGENYKYYINAENMESFAEFNYTFKFNDYALDYKYKKTDCNTVIFEELKIDNRQVLFYDKVKSDFIISLKGTENLNKNISQNNISALKYIKSNAVLTDKKESELLNKFFCFVDNMLMFRSLNFNEYIGYTNGSVFISDYIIENGLFDDFKAFFKRLNLPSNIHYQNSLSQNGSKYNFYYKFGNKFIDFFDTASKGVTSFCLAYIWLQYMKQNNSPSFVFIDEFDAFYHYELSRAVVNEFLNIANCQIILTTHDTTIMTNDLLRPDTMFIMNEGKIKSIADSTDKELRFAHNLEKMYRANSFK